MNADLGSTSGSAPRARPTAVLLVEDDRPVRDLLREQLEHAGFSVRAVGHAREALRELRCSRPDVIVCDVELPGQDGVALCRTVRADSTLAGVPVILISGSRIRTDDQIDGFDVGADDYLLKPVPSRLLVARIRAVLRRYAAPALLRKTLKAASLSLDVSARVVTINGLPVPLTRREFDLLTCFLEHRGEALRHDRILDLVWGIDPEKDVDTETLKTHVSSLRAKLGPELGDRITSLRGVGYRFEAVTPRS